MERLCPSAINLPTKKPIGLPSSPPTWTECRCTSRSPLLPRWSLRSSCAGGSDKLPPLLAISLRLTAPCGATPSWRIDVPGSLEVIADDRDRRPPLPSQLYPPLSDGLGRCRRPRSSRHHYGITRMGRVTWCDRCGSYAKKARARARGAVAGGNRVGRPLRSVQARLRALRMGKHPVTGAAIDAALPPSKPSSPLMIVNVIVSLVLGTLAAISAALAAELPNRKNHSVADAVEASELPLLGHVGVRKRRFLRSPHPALARY